MFLERNILGTGIITFSFHIRSLTGTMLNSKRTAADALAAVEELPGQVDLVLLPPDGGDGPVSDEDVDPDWVPPEEDPDLSWRRLVKGVLIILRHSVSLLCHR